VWVKLGRRPCSRVSPETTDHPRVSCHKLIIESGREIEWDTGP
jgi:hypothetical protein